MSLIVYPVEELCSIGEITDLMTLIKGVCRYENFTCF